MNVFAFFSPETFKLVMQSINPAIIAALAAGVVRIGMLVRRLSHVKWGLLLVGFVAVAYLAGAALVRDVETLKEVNDTARVDITDLELWDRFSDAMLAGDGDVRARADRTEELDIGAHAKRMDLQQAYAKGTHRLIDVLCLNSPVRGSDRRCQISLELYTNFHDRAAVDRVMQAYGYDRQTPLLLYCQEGFTSSRLAFILRTYGYDASWAALRDVKDLSIIDVAFAPKADIDVVITPLRFDPAKRYTYFLFEYDDQNPFAYQEFFRVKGTPPSASFRNVTFLQVPAEYDPALLANVGLDRAIVAASGSTARRYARQDIICRNPLHCYLTRLYLASAEVTSVKAILCVRCSDDR